MPSTATASPSLPSEYRDLPQLEGTFVGGNLKEFAANALTSVQRAHATHGDLVRLRMGPVRYLLVAHPQAVHHILTENAGNYRKETKGYRTIRKILGDGILTSNGDKWLVQRRIVQPGFHHERIVGFGDTMVRCCHEMLERWQVHVKNGERVDVNREMMALTLRVIGLTMMSMDFQKEAPGLGDALTIALTRTDELITAFPGAGLLPIAKNRALRDAITKLDAAVLGAIADREKKIEKGEDIPADLLTMLLQATDPETGFGMNATQLRDEMMTIFLAGHETTANTLSWAFYLLAQHPEFRTRLEAEVDAVKGGAAGALAVADLEKLPFTKQIIDEALRLYPPAWVIGRNSIEDDTLLGVHIPGGTNHFMSPYLLGRHPDFWENPDAFDPDRFAGNPKFIKGLYIPFIEGPRQCIGKAFALMEAQLLLATISRAVRLDLLPGQVVELEAQITLRPKGGLPMTVTSR